MKNTIVTLMFVMSMSWATAQESTFSSETKEKVKQILKTYTEMGIPGLALAVYQENYGVWSHAEGFSNLEEKTVLTTDHLFYLQSISKTYMAVSILQLYEQGKLKLDDSITQYLNQDWLTQIKGIENVTIRMLLNQTSGIAEYSTHPVLVSKILQDPLKVFTVEAMVSHIAGQPLEFEPGSKYAYRNTNYELLSLIADRITGDHVKFMENNIFKPLQLDATVYLSQKNIDRPLKLVGAYWDVLLEGIPVDISKIQRANVSSMKGDDGIVAAPEDAVNFLKGMVSGKLLQPETLELMQDFVLNEAGEKRYGMGLQFYDLQSTYAFGHSGGGIGAGCVLLYLPELDAIVFLATNFNTMMESPIRKKAENLQLEVLKALFL